jgi:hypothetical protein
MIGSVVPSPSGFKAFVAGRIGSLSLGSAMQEHFQQCVGEHMRVAAQLLDLSVGQVDGLVAQQLTAMRIPRIVISPSTPS